MGRFRKTVAPEALPGCCFVCRGTSRDFFIDVDTYMDSVNGREYDGAVYLCSECLREMVQMVGYETPETVINLKAKQAELESLNFNLLLKVDGLERAISGLSDVGLSNRNLAIWDASTHLPMDYEGAQSGEAAVGSGEGEASESVDDQRMVKLPADESEPSRPVKFSF